MKIVELNVAITQEEDAAGEKYEFRPFVNVNTLEVEDHDAERRISEGVSVTEMEGSVIFSEYYRPEDLVMNKSNEIPRYYFARLINAFRDYTERIVKLAYKEWNDIVSNRGIACELLDKKPAPTDKRYILLRIYAADDIGVFTFDTRYAAIDKAEALIRESSHDDMEGPYFKSKIAGMRKALTNSGLWHDPSGFTYDLRVDSTEGGE